MLNLKDKIYILPGKRDTSVSVKIDNDELLIHAIFHLYLPNNKALDTRDSKLCAFREYICLILAYLLSNSFCIFRFCGSIKLIASA